MIQFRKLAALFCAVCLLLTVFFGAAPRASAVFGFAQLASNSGIVQSLGLDENGHFHIDRAPAKSMPMGDADTWTIFVYLCGSDLESEGGMATYDLEEMIEGSAGSSVRYVVMTGGSLEWQNDLVDSSALELYLVEDGDITLIDSGDYYYMNDPDTLYAFLDWGVESFPAEKMGLIFWDHGGGSIAGVCIDEVFFEDMEYGYLEDASDYEMTLTLPEISKVLSRVSENMTDQFEFIGYDACLMGTLENAFMLSPYARYLYASEETEPGYGWDYTAIGQAIGSGKISGAELGKVVCDSFYDSCEDVGQEDSATLACIDLSKIDELVLAFDQFAQNMLSASENPKALASIVQNVKHVEFFGGNSKSEGYTNTVDLAGLVEAVSGCAEGGDAVVRAVNDAVVYSRNGIYHDQACGLSVYYPLHVEAGSSELNQYAEVSCSPYYYGYVAQNAYAAANGNLTNYDLSLSLNVWASAMDDEAETIYEDYGDAQITGESPYVVFCDEPQMLDDGSFGFSLDDDSIPYISSVEADIYFISDDEEDLVYLGSTTDIYADWEQGIFLDNFDGMWFCMPDEQLISAYVVSETENYSIYTTHVLLNGEESNLRFVVDYSDYTVMLDGVWGGIDEYGLADRTNYMLKPGDVIQPLFDAFNLDTDEDVVYLGDEYIYDGNNVWSYTELHDAEYYYQFCIYDIYGDNCTTDAVLFTVEDGEIYFE